jgi:hypothetical protein
MGRIRTKRPSPAIVVAVLALVAALAGTAVAGPDATTSVVTNKKVKKIAKQQAIKQINALAPGLHVASADLAADAAALGGEPPGAFQRRIPWAVVNADGTLVRGSEVVSAEHLFSPAVSGSYQVVFNRDVTNCALIAGIGRTDSANLDPEAGQIGTAYRNGVPNGVYIKTRDASGAGADRPFHLAVLC